MQRVGKHLKIAIIGLIFTSSFAVSAREVCRQTFSAPIPSNNVLARRAYQFSEFSAFINQKHPELGDRGLIVPDGGLCAVTTAAYVMTVMASLDNPLQPPRRDIQSQADLIERLVHETQSQLRVDAREGIRFDHLQRVIEASSDTLVPGLHLRATIDNHLATQDIEELTQVIRAEGLTLAAVGWNAEESHAILLLSIDTNDRGHTTVRFIDPMSPNDIKESRLILSFEGRKAVLTFADYRRSRLETLLTIR